MANACACTSITINARTTSAYSGLRYARDRDGVGLQLELVLEPSTPSNNWNYFLPGSCMPQPIILLCTACARRLPRI